MADANLHRLEEAAQKPLQNSFFFFFSINPFHGMVGPNSLDTHNLYLNPIKFVCSYGGRIAPRYSDGKLRYHGGETRVLAVDRSVLFLELWLKMMEMCGTAVRLRCQLDNEDLDTLVTITSDEDLTNLIEEYDRAEAAAVTSLKIRAFLFGSKTTKKVSPSSSSASSSTGATSPRSPIDSAVVPPRHLTSSTSRCIRHGSKPPAYPVLTEKSPSVLVRKLRPCLLYNS